MKYMKPKLYRVNIYPKETAGNDSCKSGFVGWGGDQAMVSHNECVWDFGDCPTVVQS